MHNSVVLLTTSFTMGETWRFGLFDSWKIFFFCELTLVCFYFEFSGGNKTQSLLSDWLTLGSWLKSLCQPDIGTPLCRKWFFGSAISHYIGKWSGHHQRFSFIWCWPSWVNINPFSLSLFDWCATTTAVVCLGQIFPRCRSRPACPRSPATIRQDGWSSSSMFSYS